MPEGVQIRHLDLSHACHIQCPERSNNVAHLFRLHFRDCKQGKADMDFNYNSNERSLGSGSCPRSGRGYLARQRLEEKNHFLCKSSSDRMSPLGRWILCTPSLGPCCFRLRLGGIILASDFDCAFVHLLNRGTSKQRSGHGERLESSVLHRYQNIC